VRTEDSVTKKWFVLPLLVIYLGIALIYILYLPKYNPLRPASNYARVKTSLVFDQVRHTDRSADNILVLLHRVYKSSVDVKREGLNGPWQAAPIIASLIAGSMALYGLSGKTAKNYDHHLSQQYAYLSNCTLRL
jgi:hypothetical protein